MGRTWRASITGAVLVMGLTSCGLLAVTTPIPSGGVPLDALLPIDSVELLEGGSIARFHFIGGPEFDFDNPCSVAYWGTATVEGDVLVVALHPRQHPKSLPANTGCDGMGHVRTLDVPLEPSFAGDQVRDVSGTEVEAGRPPNR